MPSIGCSSNKRSKLGGAVGFLGTLLSFLSAMVLIALTNQTAFCHGVILSYSTQEGIEIEATYDSGEPMSEAQVTVYSPESPSDPWLSGECDNLGKFFFVPDSNIPGTWEVTVRKAGHGGIMRIEVEEGLVTAQTVGSYTRLQKVLMSAAIIWGFIGTALFFKRRSR